MADTPLISRPTAFITWAHTRPWQPMNSNAWAQTVENLARRLRDGGVDVRFDLWTGRDTSVDWTRWGQRMVEESDYVVIAMDPQWVGQWRGSDKPSAGTGVTLEADTLKGLLQINQRNFQRKTLIALLHPWGPEVIPADLRRLNRFVVDQPGQTGFGQFEQLLDALTANASTTPTLPDIVDGRVAGASPDLASSTLKDDEERIDSLEVTFDPIEQLEAVVDQIPYVHHELINRVDEYAQISAYLRGTTTAGTPMVVLAGGPGVGKSALSHHWSRTNRKHFPGGELYARLNDFRFRGAVAVGEVLGQFLRVLNVREESIPVGLPERSRLFRRLTSNAAFLVVLDDVRYPAEFVALVPPGPGSAVIATSSHTPKDLIAAGVQLVPVEPLANTHSQLLLGSVIGRARLVAERGAARRLAVLCCGLPVALTVCAGRLASRPAWSIQSLVDDVERALNQPSPSSTRTKQAAINACFDRCTSDMSNLERLVYAAIGLHPGPVTSEDMISAVWPEVDASNILENFAGSRIIEDAGRGRYRMHDLLRAHARSTAELWLTDRERQALMQRTIDFYVQSTRNMDQALIPHRLRLANSGNPAAGVSFAGRREAFRWFEAERDNIVCALRAAFDRGLDEQVWCLGEALWPAYDYHKHPGEAAEMFALAAASAKRVANIEAEARMRAQLARAYLDLRLLPKAREEIIQAVELAAHGSNSHLSASIVEWRGTVQLHEGLLSQAVASFETARAEFVAIGESRGVALQDYLIGQATLLMGKAVESMDHLAQAARNDALNDDTLMHLRIQLLLGQAAGLVGQTARARAILKKVVTEADKLDAGECVARAEEALAEVALAEENFEVARAHLKRALAIYRKMHHDRAGEIAEALKQVPRPGLERG